ncbi:MAG: hypothetical protein ACE5JG_00175 [Planctomycetota bacterium]
MRSRLVLVLLALWVGPIPVRAQEEEEEGAAEHPGTADFLAAVRRQEKGKWISAKRAFRRFLKKYPDSPYVDQALLRGGDNAYLGCDKLWISGPPERRIDVSVMGDGFTIDRSDQNRQEKWAGLCLEVRWHEKAFGEYKNYFNFYFVRLASLEEGVDPNLTPEEIEKRREKNLRRRKDANHKIDFSTALDAKAAGPQGQVMMNRGLVYKWLDFAQTKVPGCGDDRFVIAFAQFGRLGMAGGGLANVGRPDKSVTTHEFGHAFSRLLDEYQGNPNPPPRGTNFRAANASGTDDPEKVPWAHFLEKKVKGVGIYEGGATFNKGVWRPARTCAMNAAGATAFCPVCREQTILVIYEYVNPIDTSSPDPAREVKAVAGDDTLLTVTPMQPKKPLKAYWYLRRLEGAEAAEEPPIASEEETETSPYGVPYGGTGRGTRFAAFGGDRARQDRERYTEPPAGEPSKLGKRIKGGKSRPRRHVFPVGKLPPGVYEITVEVRDETPYVIKDPKHLLRERLSWRVRVSPKPKAAG